MRLSTRSRYGMRFMIVLASKDGSTPVFLKDIAELEGISEKYLSQIIIPLKAKGLIFSFRGVKGGYTLSRPASQIRLREIVETLEGDLHLVSCIEKPHSCKRKELCAARDVWNNMSFLIATFLDSHTLADILADKSWVDVNGYKISSDYV